METTRDPMTGELKHQPTDPDEIPDLEQLPELVIYSHSSLFYWWPVWVVGYVMALVTYLGAKPVQLNDQVHWFHPSQNPGVIFMLTLMFVIVFTHVTLRGMASIMLIVVILFVTVLFAWLDWWDDILSTIPYFDVHMNLGFYIVFSTLLFGIWAVCFFIADRLTYWRIRPGQMTRERVVGEGEKSYDTRGMVFEKHLEDFFRHVILGLGAGDLKIMTTGARSEEIYIPNVLFVDRKVKAIQKLIAVKPDDLMNHPD